MLPPQNIFDNLSINEKTAIMTVLSRDRILREKEAERVMKLRIDLVRDKREGALIPGKFPTPIKRACARCREPLGLSISERCPCCKHLICKKCRVYRNNASSSEAKRKSLCLSYPSQNQQSRTDDDNLPDTVYRGSINVESDKDKKNANPFLSASSSESNISGINPFHGTTNSSEDSYPKSLNPFHSSSENHDDEIESMNEKNTAIVVKSSTPYTTRHRANSDFLNIPRSHESKRRHSVISYSEVQSISRTSSEISQLSIRTNSEKDYRVSSEDFSRIQIPSYNVQYSRKSTHPEDHNITIQKKFNEHLHMERKARRELLPRDSTNPNSIEKKYPFSVYERNIELTIEPATPSSPNPVPAQWSDFVDSGGEKTMSDSSAYMTAYFSSSFENRQRYNSDKPLDKQKSSSTNDISSVGRNSKAGSSTPNFSEREAIEYLIEMGRGLHQQNGSPNIDDKDDVNLNPASTVMELSTEERNSKQKDSTTENVKSKKKLSTLMSSALSSFGSIANDFKVSPRKHRDGTILSTDSLSKRRSTFSMGFLDNSRAKVINKIRELVNDKKSKTPQDHSDNKEFRNENAAKLYQMAVTLGKSDHNNLKEDDIDTSLFDINTQTQLLCDSKYHLETPNQRRVHSNPNSPYRMPKMLLPISAHRDECLSETSEITDEELIVRCRESSSSNPPDTPSSDEYFFDARNKIRFSSRKLSDNTDSRKIVKDSGYSTHENVLKARQRSRSLRAMRRSRRARDWERSLRRQVRKSARERGNRDDHVTAYISSPNLSEEDNNNLEVSHERKLGTDEKIIDIVIEGEREFQESCDNSKLAEEISISASSKIGTENSEKYVNTDISVTNLSTSPHKVETANYVENESNTTEILQGTINLQTKIGHGKEIQQRSFTNAMKWFENLGDRVRSTSFANKSGQYRNWICRVCDKSLELKKKSGDWFYLAAKPEVKEFKEGLLENRRRYSGDSSTLFPIRSFTTEGKPEDSVKSVKISPLALTELSVAQSTTHSKPLLHPPVLSRERSRTLPAEVLQVQIGESFSERCLRRQDTMDELHHSASLVRLRNRASRKSVAEVLHGTLLFHVPGFAKLFQC